MPDGDKVHPGLSYLYQSSYKQLCEGYWSNEELASSLLRSLKKDIQSFGNPPLKLAKRIASQLEAIPSEPLLQQLVDWGEESRKIEFSAKGTIGNIRANALIVKAAKQILFDLRNGERISNLSQELIRRYFQQMWISRFIGSLPLEQHYDGLDQATLNQKVTDIQPYIDKGIEAFAKQATKSSTVKPLRLLSQSRQQDNNLSLDDNLLE